jgi:hypothetical protein
VVYCTSRPVGLFRRQKFLFAARCSALVQISVDPLMNGQGEGGSDNADCSVIVPYSVSRVESTCPSPGSHLTDSEDH